MNMNTDTIIMYLTNDVPVPATDTSIADLADITNTGNYSPTTLTNTWEETTGGSGIWRLVNNADVSWTATGGGFGPFQYVAVYDTTPTTPTDILIGTWAVGSSTSITAGNTFTVDLDANFTIFTFDG